MSNLENTPEFQRGFDLHCPDIEGRDVYMRPDEVQRLLAREVAERIVNLTRQALDSLVDSPYKVDREWDMFHLARELEETNGLPKGVTAEDLMECYYRVFHGE